MDGPHRTDLLHKPGGALFFPILATPTGEATIRKLTTEWRSSFYS